MRTLLNKDGTTDVEATTGALDTAATPPGSITKLQFKAFRLDETVGYTRNYTGLSGGYQNFVFSDVVRGQALQAQANIKGIDGKRNDVVTVSGNVLARPDLEVMLPPLGTAHPQQIVDINATIGEKNGDVAATADCLLFVDGVVVDQALGIFVDSGSVVTCAFSTTFQTVGTHSIAVTAANVVPGDWDTSNNTATGSIEVVSPTTRVPTYVGMYDYAYGYRYTGSGNYAYDDGSYSAGNDWSYDDERSERYQYVYVQGVMSSFLSYPLSVSGTVATGNYTGNISSGTVAAPDYVYDWGTYHQDCMWRYDDLTGHYVSTCNYGDTGGGWQQSWFYIQHYAGAYTYFSRGHNYWWDSLGNASEYDYSYVNNYQYGTLQEYGTGMTGEVTVEAANGSFTAAGSCSAEAYEYGYQNPESCTDYSDAYTTWHQCYSSEYFYRGAGCWGYGE